MNSSEGAGTVADKGAPATIDTCRVTDRRTLRFETIDDAFRDVEQLVAAERAGRLRRLGNWTLGQALGHLATWSGYAYDGTPLKVPLWVKLLALLGKKKFMYGALRPGVRIPKVEGGTLGTDVVALDEGFQRYRSAMERMRNEAPTQPHALFGPLTHGEWIAIHLRHAELHLSFFRPP